MWRRSLYGAIGLMRYVASLAASFEGNYLTGGTGQGSGYTPPTVPLTVDLNRAGGYTPPTSPLTLNMD